MKIIKVKRDCAEVQVARLTRRINIQMLPKARAGDYVLVHAGFAIEKIDPEQAKETLRIIDEIR